MLPDPDTQRYECLFFTLRLDHDVRIPSVEGGEQRVPVFKIHAVGVRAGLLLRVLAGEVNLGSRVTHFPVGSEWSNASLSAKPPGFSPWWNASVIAGTSKEQAVCTMSATVQRRSSFSNAR